jgi:hypothetical protein
MAAHAPLISGPFPVAGALLVLRTWQELVEAKLALCPFCEVRRVML